MDKKIIIIIVGIVLVMGAILFLGNGIRKEGIYGTWVYRADPENFLEVRRDRTFCVFEGERRIDSGTWRITDNEMWFEIDRERIRVRVEGNELILYDPDLVNVEMKRLTRR